MSSSTITATELRRNVYNVLDEVLETGIAQEIVRRGKRLLIVSTEAKGSRFDGAPKRRARTCSFDELVETSWEKAWEPDI